MPDAKQALQSALHRYIADHGVICTQTMWRLVGLVLRDKPVDNPELVYGWVYDVLEATGNPHDPFTLWIERREAGRVARRWE